MTKTFDEIMASLPEHEQHEIEQRGEQLTKEYLSLQQLRRTLDLTQEQMAALLHMKQASVSRLERRTDMLISTMRAYVEAMGGSLELVARLPGRAPILIDSLADLQIDRN